MAQSLFAVSFLIGDGGDGCPSSGMNRITADARRLSDQPRSSPFGWQHRDSGNVTCSYDETGRQNTAPQREIYERVFVRFRKWPSSGSPDPIVWALKGTVEGNPALCLRVSTSGFVTLYNQGGQTAPGEAFGGKGLSLNRWYRFDVYAKFNDLTPSAPNPPYENNAAVIMTIDDVMVVYKNRQGVNPQYGVDLYNQKAAQSRLADSANAGKELEADYADWAASSDGWIAPNRRVTLARPVSAGTYSEWSSGNADYRHQLDYPFVIANIGGVSTQTASARQTYAVESLASLGITGTIVSARVAVYLESVPGGDLLLMVRRNGTDSVFNIGTAPQGAWSTWRVPTSGWSPTDAIEIGVKNASNPLGATTRLGACALLVEHDSAVSALVDREFVILNTSYTGNGTQQSVSLGSLDSDVATLTPSFVIVLPYSGNGAGAWCWDSRVYPSQTNNAGAHWGIVPRPGEVLLAGSSASSNQNGVTYRLIACFDPSQRIVARRAVALAAGSGTRNVDLAADFEPAAVFVAREQAYLNDATKIFYRGAGHGSSESVSLGVDVSAVSGAVDGWTSGEVTVGTLIKEVTQDYALSAWCTLDWWP
jgi:hypothetical protein